MTKIKQYKYLGRNGILVTPILIDGVNNIPMLTLTADEGKILTDGEKTAYSVTIEMAEADLWREIPDKVN